MSVTIISPRRRPTVAAALFLTLATAGTTGLQGQAVPGQAEDAFCWRGKPLPACGSFALFELEGALAVASSKVTHMSSELTTEHAAFGNELKWHFGAMRNVSEQWALGATVSLGTGSPSPLTGIRIRARRWLDSPVSAELEAGIVNTGINDRFGSGFGWGPTVGARLNMADRLSVFTRWEGAYAQAGSDTWFDREAGFHQGLYVGASAGSTVAVAGSAVLGAAALFVLVVLSQADW